MTAYVDYAYYSNTYLGVLISSSNFNRLALRASEVVDQVTFDRVSVIIEADEDSDQIDAIKMATCAVAEEYQRIEQSGGADGILSESVGSHSVTYAKGSYSSRTKISKMSEIAGRYIPGLMFRGFESGEY